MTNDKNSFANESEDLFSRLDSGDSSFNSNDEHKSLNFDFSDKSVIEEAEKSNTFNIWC